MVDSETTDEMMEIYSENDIIGDTGDVDMDKLRAMGKGVLRIVRQNMLNDVYETNNKKTDFLADVYFYSPLGGAYATSEFRALPPQNIRARTSAYISPRGARCCQ